MFLVNGEAKEEIPVTDRGLQYGDGLFETLEVRSGQPIFLARHINRLMLGCAKLHIPAPCPAVIQQEITELLKTTSTEPSDCVVKIMVTRGSGGRGYRQPDTICPTRIISLHPYPHHPSTYSSLGINAHLCQTRLGLNPLLAGLKHLNRLEQVLARSEWNDPNIQEGIMLDLNGHVIEGTMSNIFFVQQGILHTPLLSQCGIAGIIRAVILELAHHHRIPVREHLFNIEMLLSAEEIFVTNSIIGIWPIKQLGTNTFRVGSMSQQLRVWLDQLKGVEKEHGI